MKPFFSVIIPFYNAEDTLQECLSSVLGQTYQNYELVLVNDGSEDHGSELAEKILNILPEQKFQIIHQQNKGLGKARNAGIAEARGRYCALLDADDYWSEDKLRKSFEFLQQSPETDVFYHDMTTFGLDSHRSRKGYAVKEIKEILTKGCPLIPSACIIKTQVALENPFAERRDFHGTEDLDLWLRLLHQKHIFSYWPESLGFYREEGGMSTRLEEHLLHVKNVLDSAYRKNLFGKLLYETALQRKYYEAGRFYQKRGQHEIADRYYSAADSASLKLIGLRLFNFLGIKL